jgi:hypothetical protein
VFGIIPDSAFGFTGIPSDCVRRIYDEPAALDWRVAGRPKGYGKSISNSQSHSEDRKLTIYLPPLRDDDRSPLGLLLVFDGESYGSGLRRASRSPPADDSSPHAEPANERICGYNR